MKQPYTKVTSTRNYTQDMFRFNQPPVPGKPANPGKIFIAGERDNNKNAGTKNDSAILQDFFGALNY